MDRFAAQQCGHNSGRVFFVAFFVVLLFAIGVVGTSFGQESPVYLTIVGPRVWLAELEEYARARKPEVQSTVVAWEDLVEKSPGVDEPEKIKRFLYSQWQKREVGHLLLVGDASVTPVRYMVLDRATAAAHDYAFYPSDLYYADLAKSDGAFEDWNAMQDGIHGRYFGEVRGEKHKNDPINFDQIDYHPEIGVGRWPVRSLEELKTITGKTLQHEAAIQARRSEAALASFIAVDGWIDSRPHLDQAAGCLSGWTIEKRYYADRFRNDQTMAPTEQEVAELFGRGPQLMFHAGHGHPDHWHACVTLSRLMKVETQGHWPIVLSAGCSTAVFAPQAPYESYVDIHGVRHPGTNAGQHFASPPPPAAAIQPVELTFRSMGTDLLVASPHGAVAYYGCATGSQPCALTLLTGFAQAVDRSANKGPVRLGDAYRQQIDYYIDAERLTELQPTESWYPPSIFFQGQKFVLFGDPTLTLP
jgi:hypothetical protein